MTLYKITGSVDGRPGTEYVEAPNAGRALEVLDDGHYLPWDVDGVEAV